MRQIQKSIAIAASKEQVWDVLFNQSGEVNNFNPLIDGSHYIKGHEGHVGCERHCQIDEKTAVLERITRAEAELNFDIEIYEGGLPMMDEMKARFDLVEKNDEQTEVVLTMNYSTKPAFMGALMKGKMAKFFFKMLIGLKYHLETGELVTKENIKGIQKEYETLSQGERFPAAMQMAS